MLLARRQTTRDQGDLNRNVVGCLNGSRRFLASFGSPSKNRSKTPIYSHVPHMPCRTRFFHVPSSDWKGNRPDGSRPSRSTRAPRHRQSAASAPAVAADQCRLHTIHWPSAFPSLNAISPVLAFAHKPLCALATGHDHGPGCSKDAAVQGLDFLFLRPSASWGVLKDEPISGCGTGHMPTGCRRWEAGLAGHFRCR